MRDSLRRPLGKPHEPQFEPLYLEAPSPSIQAPPWQTSPDTDEEEEERVIIIDI